MGKTPTLVDETFFKGSQSMNFIGVYQIGQNKIRINIKKDAHEFQSYATVSVWKELEWSFIELIPPPQMEVVKANFYYGGEITKTIIAIFKKDIDALIRKAMNILT